MVQDVKPIKVYVNYWNPLEIKVYDEFFLWEVKKTRLVPKIVSVCFYAYTIEAPRACRLLID